MTSPSLERRLVERLRALGVGGEPAHLLVAVSGGMDSTVLLHLLRFGARELPLRLSVAHLDHALRPDSAGDARWLAGLCRAWEIPLVAERLAAPPRGEADARRARRRFLRRVAAELEAPWILLAHHADDQAETVLFRALRGTGVGGLAGMRERTARGVLRPLLPFARVELERYAAGVGLAWRTDPSNRDLGIARNRVRHRLLPEAERVAPGARRSLVELARLAGEAERALAREARRAERRLLREEEGALLLARPPLRRYDPAIASRVVRRALRRFGLVLSGTGTRTALMFITDAPSGRELQLPRGVRIRTEWDRARIERDPAAPADAPLRIEGSAAAEGAATIGGRRLRARWRAERWSGATAAPTEAAAAIPLEGAALPLELRGWRAGDRVRTAGGGKSLRRLFAEERVPRSRRHRLPVLADARGTVLWVGGVRRRVGPEPEPGALVLILSVTDD